MEAMLAAYGSGAAKASYDGGLRLLNVDIGGGTTKLAVIDRGRVVGTAAVHVGGRLQVVDADGRIVRLEPAGRSTPRAPGSPGGSATRRPGRASPWWPSGWPTPWSTPSPPTRRRRRWRRST